LRAARRKKKKFPNLKKTRSWGKKKTVGRGRQLIKGGSDRRGLRMATKGEKGKAGGG